MARVARGASPPRYQRPPPARALRGAQVVRDSTTTTVDVGAWLGGGSPDDTERRADALVAANEGLLRDLGVHAEPVRHKGRAALQLRTDTRVGAIPLLSPVSGKPDLGLVVEPRFGWRSAGDVLATMGFRVVPELMPVPEVPLSDRHVPPWVLSSVLLRRIEALLDATQRRFVMAHADLRAPRGAVDWTAYATTRLARGRALDVPCTYPDLQDDHELRAAVHWTLRLHQSALLGQRHAGAVVRELLVLCDHLLRRVTGVAPRVPSARAREAWHRRPLVSRAFREGVQAIAWSADERGLAGLSELSGLAWRLDMAEFFEAWVEAIAEHAVRRMGGTLRVGRRGGTRVPLDWSPPSAGSQRAVVPDVVITRDDTVVVLDAKYKRHEDEIARLGWSRVDERVAEDHRHDVLQALAYASLFDAPRVVTCLVYPASMERWEVRREQGKLVQRAEVRTGGRRVELALLAVPIGGQVEDTSAALVALLDGG